MESELKLNNEDSLSQAELVARNDRQALWSALRDMRRRDYHRPQPHIPVVLTVVPASKPAEETTKTPCAACPLGAEERGLATSTDSFKLPATKAA